MSKSLPRSIDWKVPNFTEAHSLNIKSSQHPNPEIGCTVDITAYGGPLGFQHSMTPIQARQMATALICAAAWIEENSVSYDLVAA